MIYSPVNYGLGDTAGGHASAAELLQMKRSLGRWLGYRQALDQKIGANASVTRDRLQTEQPLAEKLHSLLTQAGYSANDLPVPDVSVFPNAAATMAQMVITGPNPMQASARQGAGASALGIWPILIGVAAVLWVVASAIKNVADNAAEKERIRCIQAGACTDSGFWLKAGAIAFIAWLGWEKFGGREIAGKVRRKLS